MRKIDFAEPKTTSWKNWVAKCQAETQALIEVVQQGGTPEISNLYARQKAFFRSEEGPFKGKCAYCEQRIISNQHGDIEHFRPKKAPQNEDWSAVEVNVGGQPRPHPGYYWLAYDYRNLLFGCVLCNQVPAGKKWGKGNRFPVFGAYAINPGDEVNEHPKLINPCVDDPEKHLAFDSTGIATALTDRGKSSISILGLNERGLPEERSQAYQNVLDRFSALIGLRSERGPAYVQAELKKLRENKAGAFSAVRKAAYKVAVKELLESIPQ